MAGPTSCRCAGDHRPRRRRRRARARGAGHAARRDAMAAWGFLPRRAGRLVEVLRQADVPCECLDVNRRNPVQAVARLARGLRRFKPQLVQSFMFHANLAARLAAPWAGCPWVVGGLRVAERQKRWHLTRGSPDRSLGHRLGVRIPGCVAVQPRRSVGLTRRG